MHNDVARLWSAGFALGASFENSVVSTRPACSTPRGCATPTKCARHKVLDVIGDLALSGLPLLRRLSLGSRRHKLNHACFDRPDADRSAWRVVEAETARRSRNHAEAEVDGGGMIAPAYGPDVS